MKDETLPKTITISEAQWKAVQEKLGMLEDKIIGSPIKSPQSPKNRTVTVTFIEGQPVIGYANRGTESSPRYVYNGQSDPQHHNEFIQFVDVLVRNPDPKALPNCFSIPFTQFLQESEKKDCSILEKSSKEWSVDQGVTTGRTYQDGTYFMIESGVIPVEVKGLTTFYTVQLPDGSAVKLHERYVNITK